METQNIQSGAVPPAFDSTPVFDSTPAIDFSSYDAYYKEEFTKIAESNGTYKGKWNWYAFLFSTLWLLSKKAWAMALIVFISSLVTYNTTFYFIVVLGWALLCGRRGTWIYYNVKIKNKQMAL